MSIRVKNDVQRSVLIRWQSGVWGLGSECPKCKGYFRTSHVAKCGLFDDQVNWREFVARANHISIDAVAKKEVQAGTLDGFCLIDAALSERQWRTAKLMLVDLAAMLPGITDWQGWDAQHSFPDMPASSQDVSDSDDMIDDDDDDDVG